MTAGDLTGPTGDWPAAEVPGCWTMQGFDRPQYTNVQMPFPGPPPSVPNDNPTGVYRRTVTVPADWHGKRIVLHVGGAESVLYVHVNGEPVGMGKDSRLPQEFDLTAIVEPGRSFELALTVVRWSDATYLEDQDHWFHAGLHRRVFVYATPPVHIADVHTVADFDPGTGRGFLRADVRVGGDRPRGLDRTRGDRRPHGRGRGALRAPDQLPRELPALRRPGRDRGTAGPERRRRGRPRRPTSPA